jgi:leader peptidase (prepilin peptidase)/N-methyltransferase
MVVLITALSAALGAIVGSFVNVVVWRVPRGESIMRPGSHCPSCSTPLRATELVPVLSWVCQRGRCRTCGVRISPRYPLVELAGAACFGAIAWLLAGSSVIT